MTKLTPIHYSQPTILPQDVKEVEKVLQSNWLTTGPKIKELEKAMAEFTGYRFCVAVGSATDGLEVAYKWYFNDRRWVFIPTLTFVATANMAFRQGLEIKFTDADDKTWASYSPDVSISYAGYPLQGNGLVADDAHYLFRDMGKYGNYKARILSFHAVKPLPCGDGGAILTNDEEFYNFALEYRNHGRNSAGLTTFPGGNLRMTDIQAALLISQLGRWEESNKRRHQIAKYYQSELTGLVETPPYHKRHALHLFPIKFESTEKRDAVRAYLAEKQIYTQLHYQPVHTQPLYQHIKADCPVADDHYARSLSIPLHLSLIDEQIEYIIVSIKQAL